MSDLETRTIAEVRELTDEELENQYWPTDNRRQTRTLVLDDGTRLFASCDPEGNAPGFLAGIPDDPSEIIDAEITAVFQMREDDAPADWTLNPHNPAPPVLTLDTGDQLYPLQDPEANGPGALFGIDGDTDEQFIVIFQS